MATGSFPGVESGRGMTLTPHPLLVPRSENRVELYLYSPYGPSWPIKKSETYLHKWHTCAFITLYWYCRKKIGSYTNWLDCRCTLSVVSKMLLGWKLHKVVKSSDISKTSNISFISVLVSEHWWRRYTWSLKGSWYENLTWLLSQVDYVEICHHDSFKAYYSLVFII